MNKGHALFSSFCFGSIDSGSKSSEVEVEDEGGVFGCLIKSKAFLVKTDVAILRPTSQGQERASEPMIGLKKGIELVNSPSGYASVQQEKSFAMLLSLVFCQEHQDSSLSSW